MTTTTTTTTTHRWLLILLLWGARVRGGHSSGQESVCSPREQQQKSPQGGAAESASQDVLMEQCRDHKSAIQTETTSKENAPSDNRREATIDNDLDEDWDDDDWNDDDWEDWGYEQPTQVDFVATTLAPTEMAPLRWLTPPNEPVTDYAFEMGLAPEVTRTLRDFCDRVGVTDAFRKALLGGEELPSEAKHPVDFHGASWYINRSPSKWMSNQHWIGVNSDAAYQQILHVLSAAGFDAVLKAIGNKFNMNGLTVFDAGFYGVSKCEEGYIHSDFVNVKGKAFHVVFPLVIATNHTRPDLVVFSDDYEKVGGYRYAQDVALVFGDYALHATANIDYQSAGEMRVSASVFVADITKDNVEDIAATFSSEGDFSEGDPDTLLERAGAHWSRTDPNRKLPSAPEAQTW